MEDIMVSNSSNIIQPIGALSQLFGSISAHSTREMTKYRNNRRLMVNGLNLRLCCLMAVSVFCLSSHLFIYAFVPTSSLCTKKLTPLANVIVPIPFRHNKSNASLQLSPSGIDEWPQIYQAAVFFGIYAALAIITIPTTKLLENISKSIGMERWRNNMIDSTLPILLGTFYLAAGIGHFVSSEAFQDIYPPMGTWGIWYLPGSAEFHVAWTGIVEALGASGLLLSSLRDILGIEQDGATNFVKPISASLLFVLTILVTPANIYMLTHGAVMGDMAPLDVSFHIVRFGVQVLLLSLLLTLARDSFFFAWGEELD